jgi:hypothetical protein
MARRTIKTQTVAQKLNNLKPRPGMFVEVYFYKSDIGGGIRSFLVTRVGRKYIYLFYVPQLKELKFTFKEWQALALTDRNGTIMRDVQAFRERLLRKAKQFDRLGIVFQHEAVKRAIELCGGKYGIPDKVPKG